MGGSNFADVLVIGEYTYEQRAIPYVENEAAYHSGLFNNTTYFDKIDAIKAGDMECLNAILRDEGISEVNAIDFQDLQMSYSKYVTNTIKNMEVKVGANPKSIPQ